MECVIKEPSKESNFLTHLYWPKVGKSGPVALVYRGGDADIEVLRTIDQTVRAIDPRVKVTDEEHFSKGAQFDSPSPPRNHRLNYYPSKGLSGKDAAMKIIQALLSNHLISQDDYDNIFKYRDSIRADLKKGIVTYPNGRRTIIDSKGQPDNPQRER